MKIVIDRKNYRIIFGEVKRKIPKSLSIWCGVGFFSSAKTLKVLKNIADFCIEKNIRFGINNIPFCFLLGYKRYIILNGGKKLLKKSKKCETCLFFNECSGFPKKNATAIEAAISPIRRNFTDLEICMLKILEKKNNITTEEVLKLSKGIKICASCTSAGEVLRVTDRLIKLGIIKMESIGGKYLWSKK